MNNQEYEQKRRECWEEYKRENLDGEVQWQPVSRYDVFNFAFDRAYALGKQEKDAKRSKRMCLRDRTKVCNQCHECDIDISNPYHNNVILS